MSIQDIENDMRDSVSSLEFVPQRGACCFAGRYVSVMLVPRQVARGHSHIDVEMHVDLVAPPLETEPEILDGIRQACAELRNDVRPVIRRRADETLRLLDGPRLSTEYLANHAFCLRGQHKSVLRPVVTNDEGVGILHRLATDQAYRVQYVGRAGKQEELSTSLTHGYPMVAAAATGASPTDRAEFFLPNLGVTIALEDFKDHTGLVVQAPSELADHKLRIWLAGEEPMVRIEARGLGQYGARATLKGRFSDYIVYLAGVKVEVNKE